MRMLWFFGLIAISLLCAARLVRLHAYDAPHTPCGLPVPRMKPPCPIGCKDLERACVAGDSGREFHWGWVCIPNEAR